jgi:hypothetical protein
VQISELNDSERSWLQAHLEVARTFVGMYAVDPRPASLTPETLDAAWSAWIPSAADQPEVANTIVNAAGAAIGQFLVDTAGFRWVVATDEGGAEMAVIALEGTADAIVYPMNMVAKRYETKETRFVHALIEGIRDRVAGVQGGRPKGGHRDGSHPTG